MFLLITDIGFTCIYIIFYYFHTLSFFSGFPYPNQALKPLGVGNQGYGYIPPQIPVYPQPPSQMYQYPYGGGYPYYPSYNGGGYYPNYGTFPQKPFKPNNYLDVYDNNYFGGRPLYK